MVGKSINWDCSPSKLVLGPTLYWCSNYSQTAARAPRIGHPQKLLIFLASRQLDVGCLVVVGWFISTFGKKAKPEETMMILLPCWYLRRPISWLPRTKTIRQPKRHRYNGKGQVHPKESNDTELLGSHKTYTQTPEAQLILSTGKLQPLGTACPHAW